MKNLFALTLTLIALPAFAIEHNQPAELAIDCNENGAVITLGDNTIEPGAKYYVGKDCDAFRPGLGAGAWWFAASGFIIEINGEGIRFSNELDCPSLPYCKPQ